MRRRPTWRADALIAALADVAQHEGDAEARPQLPMLNPPQEPAWRVVRVVRRVVLSLRAARIDGDVWR